MSRFIADLKTAWQSLKGAPGFVATVVTVLGVTLALLVVAFKINYVLFVEPFPYPDQDKLYKVDLVSYSNGEPVNYGHSQPSATKIYKDSEEFSNVGLIFTGEQLLSRENRPVTVNASFISPSVFELTGARATIGRLFDENEDIESNQQVAILSYDSWQSLYEADPDIVGQTISVRNIPFRVVGVLSQDYMEPELGRNREKTQIWLPWNHNPDSPVSRSRWRAAWQHVHVLGKIENQVAPDIAESALSNLISPFKNADIANLPYAKNAEHKITLTPLNEAILGDSVVVATLMMLVVIILLAISATIILVLFLSRIMQRQRILGIQAALGASLRHLLAMTLRENMVVMAMTWLFSIVCAQLIIKIITTSNLASQYFPKTQTLSLDLISLAFGAVVALVLALFFTFYCVAKIRYRQLSQVLQQSGKGSGMQVSRRTQTILMSVLIGLAFVLLFINSQVFSDSLSVVKQSMGLNENRLYHIHMRSTTQMSSAERKPVMEQIRREVGALPFVEDVSLFPIRETIRRYRWALSKDPSWEDFLYVAQMGTDGDYLRTSGLPLLKGRNFTEEEIRTESRVMLVSETLAKHISPDMDVIDKLVYTQQVSDRINFRIIGVVGDIVVPYIKLPVQRMNAYFPTHFYHTGLSLRLNTDEFRDIQQVEDIIRSADSRLFIHKLTDIEQEHREIIRADIFGAAISGSLAIISILLAFLGIFSITSYNLKLRRHELGIRMSLGSAPRHIYMLAIKETSVSLLAGLVMSAVLLVGVYQFAAGFFEQGMKHEVSTLVISLFVIVCASGIGIYSSLYSLVSKWPAYSLRLNDQAIVSQLLAIRLVVITSFFYGGVSVQ